MLAAALLTAGMLSRPAKAEVGDEDWYRNHTKMCLSQMENYKGRADAVRSYVGAKGHGWVESSDDKSAYKAALDQYNTAKKGKAGYSDWGARISDFSMNMDGDACGASDGFMNYEKQMEIENDATERAYLAKQAAGSLTDAQKAIKAQLEPCVASLKTAIDTNNKLNEASKNIFHTSNPQLTTVGAVNGKLSGFVQTYAFTYTASNLGDCQKLAADTTVQDEYNKLSGQKFQQVQSDAAAQAAAQAKIDAQKAADKKAYDDAHTPEAIAKAKAAQKARQDAEDAAIAQQRANELKAMADNNVKCANDANTRMGALGNRMDAMMKAGVVGSGDVSTMVNWQKQINQPLGKIIVNKSIDVDCHAILPLIDQYDQWIAGFEAKKRAADEQAARDEADRQAKAEVERKRWLAEHPTDISGACHNFCMTRHAGPGPKETECERECQVTQNALKEAADIIGDELLKPFDAALDKLGVSKALCEAAQSKVGEILAKANAATDKLAGKVKEQSKDACERAGQPKAKCAYVGKAIGLAQAVKECGNTSKILQKSHDTAAQHLDERKKFEAEQKAKKDKEEARKNMKKAVAETAKESAETCESAKASDLIANIMKPCTEALEDAVYLAEHAGDYSSGGGAAEAKPEAQGKAPLKIIEATYGGTTKPVVVRSCPDVKTGNATSAVRDACAGKSSCDFKIKVGDLGDPAPGCVKGFSATFKCGDTTKTATLNASAGEANGQTLTLSCGG